MPQIPRALSRSLRLVVVLGALVLLGALTASPAFARLTTFGAADSSGSTVVTQEPSTGVTTSTGKASAGLPRSDSTIATTAPETTVAKGVPGTRPPLPEIAPATSSNTGYAIAALITAVAVGSLLAAVALRGRTPARKDSGGDAPPSGAVEGSATTTTDQVDGADAGDDDAPTQPPR